MSSFSYIAGATPVVKVNGSQLKAVTNVRLSAASCEPTAGTEVPILSPKTDTSLKTNVTGIPPGDYHIITLSVGGSCCTATTVHVP